VKAQVGGIGVDRFENISSIEKEEVGPVKTEKGKKEKKKKEKARNGEEKKMRPKLKEEKGKDGKGSFHNKIFSAIFNKTFLLENLTKILYYKTSRIRNIRQMDRFRSKLVL
jgi:hypothetical protein